MLPASELPPELSGLGQHVRWPSFSVVRCVSVSRTINGVRARSALFVLFISASVVNGVALWQAHDRVLSLVARAQEPIRTQLLLAFTSSAFLSPFLVTSWSLIHAPVLAAVSHLFRAPVTLANALRAAALSLACVQLGNLMGAGRAEFTEGSPLWTLSASFSPVTIMLWTSCALSVMLVLQAGETSRPLRTMVAVTASVVVMLAVRIGLAYAVG